MQNRKRSGTNLIITPNVKDKTSDNPKVNYIDQNYCIRDTKLYQNGMNKLKTSEEMLLGLKIVSEANKNKKPLKDAVICGCTVLNSQYAVLIKLLYEFGANITWCSSNFNIIDDDICSALVKIGINIFAWEGENNEDYVWCIEQCIKTAGQKIDFIIDDGGDLTDHMLTNYKDIFDKIKGIVEKSSYGMMRLYNLIKEDKLTVPAMNITGSISLDQTSKIYYFRDCLLKCLDISEQFLINGLKFLVIGYGHRGKACVKTLKIHNAIVYISEVDPICALQACIDGLEVVSMESVLPIIDVILLCTDNKNIIDINTIKTCKNNTLIINYGFTTNFINQEIYKNNDIKIEDFNLNVIKLVYNNQKSVRLLFKGEPVQTISFPLPDKLISIESSLICVAILELNIFSNTKYTGGVYLVPRKLDEYVALTHLKTYSATLMKLTDEQSQFLGISKDGPFKTQLYKY